MPPLATALAILALAVAQADGLVFSGPQAGEKLSPVKVRGVFDGDAGKEFDPVAMAAGKPLILVFVHEANRPSVAMTRALMADAATRARDGLARGVVWLADADDFTTAEQFLKRARHALPDKAPLGVSVDGVEGPGAYGLNRNVTLTVLVAKDNVVSANFALVQPSLASDAPRVIAEVVKLVGGKVPTPEELAALAAGGPATPGRPDVANEALRGLIRPVIQREATPEQVDKAAAAVEAYIKDRPEALAEVGRIARTVVNGGKLDNYGTPRAQQVLKDWAERFGKGPRP